jgi:hypothetical protein
MQDKPERQWRPKEAHGSGQRCVPQFIRKIDNNGKKQEENGRQT